MKVLKFPLARISLFFILGIVVAHYTKTGITFAVAMLLASVIVTIICFLAFRKNTSKLYFFGIATFVTSFFIGFFTSVSHNQTYNPKHYIHQISNSNEPNTVQLILIEKLKNTAKNDRYIAKVISINNKESYGKIILNINKTNNLPVFDIGSNIKANGVFYKNRTPNNPNIFDYGSYLENQQIYAQFYTDISKIQIGTIKEKSLTYYASKLRNRIIHNLEKNNFHKTELSVVVALILGQQQDISPEVIHDYQYAGAVHVLSVSGLHVGFILLFVMFLLKPFPNTKKFATIKLILVLISLWLFGILAGLAPCVLRSVTMFSFVAIGLYLRRTVNIYHTLLVSMLLILLFDPSFLFEIGFQLSYLALFFIVWFQPLLDSAYEPNNKIIKYIWEIITVSIAAQLGTFPLSLYYFHQFPTLFLLTNIIILPSMSIILGLGVLVMVLAAFNVVWFPMMKLLELFIYWLNLFINWVASFEKFVFKDIPFSFLMMLSCYLLIISTIIWMKKPNYKKLVVTLSFVILFQLIVLQAKYSSQRAEEFIVFNVKKSTMITQRKGNEITLFANDSILENPDDNLTLKPYLVANFSNIKTKKPLTNLFYFKDKKVMLIDESAVYLQNVNPDILVLIQSPKVNLERLFETVKPKIVVADASNYKSYVKVWKATCEKQKIPFHDTNEKGFYKF